MKKTISILSACVVGAGALIAQVAPEFTVKEFPPRLAPAQVDGKVPSNLFKAPLNTMKPLGPKMFATTMVDSENTPQFVNFYQNTPHKLNKLNYVYLVDDPDESYYPPLYMFWSGAMTDRGYYGYKVKYYTSGILRVFRWLKVDPETGEHEVAADLNYADIYNYWENIYDLTYNWNSKKLYGLAQNEDKTVSSMIGEIDIEDGHYDKTVYSSSQYYLAMAYSMDDEYYLLRWVPGKKDKIVGTAIDVLDKDFKLVRTIDVKVDGQAFMPYYQHGLDFDHTTGDLWWLATNTVGRQYLVKIDPETGESKNYGSFGFNEEGLGLYVPFITGDSRTAPAQVKDLAFEPSSDGSNEMTLSWTNPTTQWNRKPLTSMDEVYIYRDDMKSAPIAKIAAKDMMGEKMTWKDNVSPRGLHKYFVTASNEDGNKGVPDTIWAYVGKDVVGPVNNLKAETPNGRTVTLTWDAPDRGDNDGWYDNTDITYRVTRMPDNKVFADVITGNRFEDLDIPEARKYTYIVTSYNKDGKGGAAESNALIAGNALVPPIAFDFDDKDNADRFSCWDVNGDGMTFSHGFNTNTSKQSFVFINHDESNNDMLISPALKVKKGNTYRVDFKMSVGGYGTTDRIMHHTYNITGGVGATPADQTTILCEVPDFMTKELTESTTLTHYFVSPVDGEYNIALQWMNEDEKNMWIYVEGFSFEEVGDNDLAATELITFLTLSTNESDNNIFNVDIYNNGLKAQKNYKVEVGRMFGGKFNSFAEALDEDKPEIKSHETKTIALAGVPSFHEDGEIIARVVLEGDSNPDNDYSAPVKIAVTTGAALNYTVTEERHELETTAAPVCHFMPYTNTQTIYTPDMTGIEGLESNNFNVEIGALAWEYSADADMPGSHIKVYLSTTDKDGYDPKKVEWLPVPSTPVYEGNYDIKAGRNNLYIPLSKLYKFDARKNLVITVHNEDKVNNDFLMRFTAFDGYWTNDLFHSMKYAGKEAQTSANSNANSTCIPEAPALHLAVYGINYNAFGSVEEVVVQNSVRFDASNNTVSSFNGVKEVKVYNYTGALTGVYTARNGENSIRLNLDKGLYILDVVENNGNRSSLKISARH